MLQIQKLKNTDKKLLRKGEIGPSQSFDLDKSRQSFLNEVRGRLLEFSCGLNLAEEAGIQSNFLSELTPSELGELTQYQDYLRKNDPNSYEYILKAGKNFLSSFSLSEINDLKKVRLTGKLQEKDKYGEADLFLSGRSDKWISIKLIQEKSYVNSKSAGIKSIFEKYFQSPLFQKSFNNKIDQYFLLFKLGFYQYFDTSLDEISFSDLCKQKGVSDRPGLLSPDLKSLLYQFYQSCIGEVHAEFVRQYEKNPDVFIRNIFPLAGFSNNSMIVYIFGHDKIFQKLSMKYYDHRHLKTNSIKISEINGNTSFNIELDQLSLQIRVKPMNSFLAPSMKVNCSVKFKGD